MLTLKQYAKELSTVIDGRRYTNLMTSIGPSLNERKLRFDKADFAEGGVEAFSEGRLKWIDETGRDHLDTKHNHHVEFKFISHGLITKKGNLRKNVNVRVVNKIGNNQDNEPLIDSLKSDYYMIGQENSLAIITRESLSKYLVRSSDAIIAKIPLVELEFVHRSVTPTLIGDIDYKSMKRELQKRIIGSF